MLFYSLVLLSICGLSIAQNPFQNLTELLNNIQALSTVNQYVKNNTAISSLYAGLNNVTCFLPGNTGFQAVLAEPSFAPLFSDPSYVTAFLQYSCIEGVVLKGDIQPNGEIVHSLLNNSIKYANISTGGQVLKLQQIMDQKMILSGDNSSAYIVTADIPFQGGYVQVLDVPIGLPSDIASTGAVLNLTSIVSGPQQYTVASAESYEDVTFFALSNNAYTKATSQTSGLNQTAIVSIYNNLLVHPGVLYSSSFTTAGVDVLTVEGGYLHLTKDAGGLLFVNGARVTQADLVVTNGVLHVIDSPVYPAGIAPAGASSYALPTGTPVAAVPSAPVSSPPTPAVSAGRLHRH